MRAYKEKNWRGVVQDLKAGPNFGIHGTKHRNLLRILEDRQSLCVIGHYFSVSNYAKNLPENEFYDRLYGSVSLAYRLSAGFEVSGEEARFFGLPSILLAVEKECGIPYTIMHCNPTDVRITSYGRSEISLPIGHTFLRDFVNLDGLVIEESEIDSINEKFLKYVRRTKRKYGVFSILESEYFIEREVVRRFMSKIHEAIKGYRR